MWGVLPKGNKDENQFSLEKGFSLLSCYRTAAGQEIWVITEADRSHPTLPLLDEE